MDADEAIADLVGKSGDRLLRLAFQLCHDRATAEDLVQQALEQRASTRVVGLAQTYVGCIDGFGEGDTSAIPRASTKRGRQRTATSPVGVRSFSDQRTPPNAAARLITASSIGSVSRPVKVFCWLTW